MYVLPCEFNTGYLNCHSGVVFFYLMFKSQALKNLASADSGALKNLASADSGPHRIHNNLCAILDY